MGIQKDNNLIQFMMALASDPGKQEELLANYEQTIAASNLETHHKDLLLSRDQDALIKAIAEETDSATSIVALIYDYVHFTEDCQRA